MYIFCIHVLKLPELRLTLRYVYSMPFITADHSDCLFPSKDKDNFMNRKKTIKCKGDVRTKKYADTRHTDSVLSIKH